MHKIKININGNSFEAEGENLMDIINQFLDESIDDVKNNNDVPKPYENYEDYLSLIDLDVAKCSDKEKYDDLKDKLQKRLDWIKKHPKADTTEVEAKLKVIYDATKQLIRKLDYIKAAYEAVQLYYVNVNSLKKNENKG